jgi:dolichyl-phosphate beta-glucosyltransferase
MSAPPFLSVIVPAYNESHVIGSTLCSMRSYLDQQKYSYEIIVSADGNDGTREKVAELARYDRRLSVIGSAQRGGNGRAIRNAVAQARGEIIGFIDADYKTPIEEVEKILPWFDGGYDLVIGSRAVPGAVIENPQKWYRRVGSWCFGKGMHLLVGLWRVHDTQCGFKFYRGPVARDLFQRLRIDGYMFDVDVLFLAEQTGYRTREVGIRWRDDGDSRLALVSGNWQNFKDLLRIQFSTYPYPVAQPASPAAMQEAA